MRDTWRDGSFAELVKLPLENVYALDEAVLCGQLCYDILDLPILHTLLVPFGGLDAAGVRPGDVVLVAPATGKFGGAAVAVACAMGARVIAAGRNEQALVRLKKVFRERVSDVVLKGEVEADYKAIKAAAGPKGVDVFYEINPPAAGANGATPSSIIAGIRALRHGGTCVIMGGISGNIAIPCSEVMFRDLKIMGKFMYSREQVERMIKLVEVGGLRMGAGIGSQVVGRFGLEEVDRAMEMAAENGGWGTNVALLP